MEESGIRKVFEMAAQNQGDMVDFSIGQPHFYTPESLKESLCRAGQEDFNRYTSTKGLQGLREQIVSKLQNRNGISASMEEVMVTSGVSGAIFLSLASIVDPGDEVVLPDPYFVLYKQLLDFLGAETVFWDTYPDFHPDPDKLKKLINSRTKAVILNTPNNPTGMVYSRSELEKVAEVAEQKGVWVLADEVYEKFDFDNRFFSIGSIYDKTITWNGFSKSHLITGWRVGYVHAPAEIIEAMNKLQQYTFVCAPAPTQRALELEGEIDLSHCVNVYKSNRDLLVSRLKSEYQFRTPEGGYYAFVKYPEGKKDLVQDLIRYQVLVIPGEVFSRKSGYFRISLAVDPETLKKGIEILNKII